MILIKLAKEVMPVIFPKHLKKGDLVGIIAPSSPISEKALKIGVHKIKEMGYRVKLGTNVFRENGYLAGTDKERLADFHEMILDSNVKAIFFARGGYGSARIAHSINYADVKNNPKIIWGYSDITYLHTAIRQKTGLVTFHGPMVESDMGTDNFNELSLSMFEQLLKPTKLIYSESISPLKVLSAGKATGKLVGGNLSLLVSTIGTPFEIDTKNKILFIEDIGESPYEVDRMLNQLKMSNKLSEVTGIVIGDFAKTESKKGPTLTLDQVFNHYLNNELIPVMSGFKIGHCTPHFAIPLGTEATINTNNKTLIMSPGVI